MIEVRPGIQHLYFVRHDSVKKWIQPCTFISDDDPRHRRWYRTPCDICPRLRKALGIPTGPVFDCFPLRLWYLDLLHGGDLGAVVRHLLGERG